MKYLDKDGLGYAWKKIQTYLDKKTNNADLLDKIYPVGSIYLTMGDKSPADLFGGTWKKLSGGYLYANSSDAGNTGGSNSFTINPANLPSHTHSIPSHVHSIPSHTHSYIRADSVNGTTLTENQMASHMHTFGRSNQGGGKTDWGLVSGGGHGGMVILTNGNGYSDSGYTGGNASHNHGLSSSWQSTGATSGNTGATSATSGATGSGTAVSIRPTYINVYMWQRTA